MSETTSVSEAPQAPVVIAGSRKWEPTALEMFQLAVATLGDKIPGGCGLGFVHGAPIRNDDLDHQVLSAMAMLYLGGQVKKIVLNGLTEEMCRTKNLAYAGYEPWWRKLILMGLHDDDIIILEASAHTAAESSNLLKLAKTNGVGKIVIASHPHHLPRCALQIVAEMNKMAFLPNVYFLASGGIDWHRPCEKPVMAGGTGFTKDEKGPFHEFVVGEFNRIDTYAQNPDVVNGKAKFTPNATVPEFLEYMAQRNQR